MKIYKGHFSGLIAVLFMVSCQGLRMPQSPLLVTFERKSGRIVYVGTDSNIYTMNQAGQDVFMITEQSGVGDDIADSVAYFYPAWAPDGRKLAFVGYQRGSGTPLEASLYTAKYDGTELAKVFSEPGKHPFYVYWLPSSKEISFLSDTEGDNRFVMDIVSVDGEDSQEIGRGIPFYWAWSPDSNALISHRSKSTGADRGGDSLSLVRVGETVVDTSLNIRPSLFQSPVYSPDGKYFVAGIQSRTGRGSLMLANETGDWQEVLAEFDGQAAFDWSPDGNRLAYITGKPTVYGMVGELILIELSDIDNPVVSDTNAGGVIAFFWDHSGRKVAYFALGEADGSEGASQDFTLVLSVLDVESGESLVLTKMRPTDAFMTQVVPHFDQYQRSSTIWSPNNRYLVINSITDDSRPGIFVIDATGNLEPRLANYGVMPFWSNK